MESGQNPKTVTQTDSVTVTLNLNHEGTDCWALLHGTFDYLPISLEKLTENFKPGQIQVVFPTDQGLYMAQSQKGYMSIGLGGVSDYSNLIEQQREKCHCGTYSVDNSTYLMMIQKKILTHFINITYQTCQKLYQKTPTRFYLRVNSKSEDQDNSQDIITTERPEDTSRYVQIENFEQYLGATTEDETFQVRLYNHDKSQCLAQVSQY